MKVDLHIDRLVLDGIDPGANRGELVSAAVAAALEQAIADRGLGSVPVGGFAVESMRAPAIETTSEPAALGTAIAQSLHTGLTR